MVTEALEQTEKELQSNLARKAELLDALEQVEKQIEQGRLVLQVLKFAQQSAETTKIESDSPVELEVK